MDHRAGALPVAHAEGSSPRSSRPGGGGRWAFAVEALDAGTPRFCGTVELRLQADGRAEIAYGAHPWARGRGIMRRAHPAAGLGLRRPGPADRRLVGERRQLGVAADGVAARLLLHGTVRGYLPQRGELLDGWVGTLHAASRARLGPWLSVPVVEGGRVRLRPFTDPTCPGSWRRAPTSRRRTGCRRCRRPTPPRTRAPGWRPPRAPRHRVGGHLGGRRPGDRPCLGAVNAFGIVAGREAEVGYWVHPDARGRGVASEACASCWTTASRRTTRAGSACPGCGSGPRRATSRPGA